VRSSPVATGRFEWLVADVCKSVFYIALLTLMCGFLGGAIVNSSVDAYLGYAITEVGPRWSQRRPVPISRWQTLLIKWVIAAVLAGLTTGLMLLVAAGLLRMDAPHAGLLWLLTWLAATSGSRMSALLPVVPQQRYSVILVRSSQALVTPPARATISGPTRT